MDALELLVRDVLREHAADAPAEVPAVRSRPTQRWLYAAAAAVLIVGLAVVVVALRRTSSTAPPAEPPAGYKWVSYHGITLAVPHTLVVTDGICGPTPNSVDEYNPDAPAAACTGHPFWPASSYGTLVFLQPSSVPSRATFQPGKRPSKHVVVASSGVDVRVQANSQTVVDTIVSSIEVTPVDRLGCAAVRPNFATPLHVGTPLSAVVCDYVNNSLHADQWLRGSGRARADEVPVLVRMATAAPWRPDVPPVVVRFGYADGSTVLAAVPRSSLIDSIVR